MGLPQVRTTGTDNCTVTLTLKVSDRQTGRGLVSVVALGVFCFWYLTGAAQRPPVGQLVLPSEVQAPLLAGDERFSPWVGGPRLHIGRRRGAQRLLHPPPSSTSCRRGIHTSTLTGVTSPRKPDTARFAVAGGELIRT